MSNKELEMKAREHDMSDVDAEVVAEAAGMAAKEAVAGYEKIEAGVVTGYKKIETGVVEGYKKIETGVVEGFGRVVDKCVEALFAKEGESVEEAKKRLNDTAATRSNEQ